MLPPVTDHETAVFEVPVTVALNCTVPPAATVDVDGVSDKDTVASGRGRRRHENNIAEVVRVLIRASGILGRQPRTGHYFQLQNAGSYC